MKTPHKKLVGGLLVSLLIATIGAALATGQIDDTTNDTPLQPLFRDHHGRIGLGSFGTELTDEQQTELEELMTSLREQNTTPNEIRTAIQEKLDGFGVLDTRLDNEIAQTEQQLTILNRQKELRNEGLSWDEISGIIEDEFDLVNTTGIGWDTIGGPCGFGQGPHGGPRDCITLEESDE